MIQQSVLGIDIGGTGIKAAIVDIQRGILNTAPMYTSTPQPSNPSAIFNTINEMLHTLKWEGGVGCGFPGIIKNGYVILTNNLGADWEGVDFTRKWQRYIRNDVSMINDADAAALAEMHFGAGKAYNKSDGGVVITLTLGTGIGSGIFVNGHLMPNTELGLLEFEGNIAEKSVATVIKEREDLSWSAWSKRLNRYLNTLETYFSPNLFIIGGGISESSEKFFQLLKIKTEITAAQMGNQAGIIGAALHYSIHERI